MANLVKYPCPLGNGDFCYLSQSLVGLPRYRFQGYELAVNGMVEDESGRWVKYADVEAALLRAGEASPSPWQPIETAPKDRHILLAFELTHNGHRAVTESMWGGHYWSGFHEPGIARLLGWQDLPEPPQ